MADNDQTPVPNKGQEQQGTPPTSAIDPVKLLELETELKKIGTENRMNQARADKAEATLSKTIRQPVQRATPLAGPQAPRGAGPQSSQASEQISQLQEIAQDQAKELLLLKEAGKYGFTYEQVQEIQFDSPNELRLQLEIMKQGREVEELKATMQKQAPQARIDTGGPSGAPLPDKSQRVQGFRDKASEFRKAGQHTEATWMALRAAHSDPSKRIIVASEDE